MLIPFRALARAVGGTGVGAMKCNVRGALRDQTQGQKRCLYFLSLIKSTHTRSFFPQAGEHIIPLIRIFPVDSRPFTLERSSFSKKTTKGH